MRGAELTLREKILGSRWFWVLSLVILISVIFALAKIAKQRHEIDQAIADQRATISELKKENKQLASLLDYYQTDFYKEQVARRELGLQKPGEEVVAFSDNVDNSALSDKVDRNGQVIDSEKPLADLNAVKWWVYFFGK